MLSRVRNTRDSGSLVSQDQEYGKIREFWQISVRNRRFLRLKMQHGSHREFCWVSERTHKRRESSGRVLSQVTERSGRLFLVTVGSIGGVKEVFWIK